MTVQAGCAIELGFYRGTSLVSRLIKWQTRSIYSHVAGRRADTGDVLESWYPSGVHVRRDWLDAHKPQTQVDVYLVPDLTADQAATAWAFASAQLGRKYDLRAVLRFVPRWRAPRSSRSRWFCSELWAEAFARAGLPLLRRVASWAVAPGALSQSPLLLYSHSLRSPAAAATGDDAADRVWIDLDLARRNRPVSPRGEQPTVGRA